MAKGRSKYNQALRRWQELHRQERYSEPAKYGRLAIIVSCSYDVHSPYNDQEIEQYKREADELAKACEQLGKPADVHTDAKGNTIRDALADTSISDIITIGHGTLSMLYIDTGIRRKVYSGSQPGNIIAEVPNQPFDWHDVSESATHLKLGTFVQRQCGGINRHLAVPLGLFAVSCHANVYAAVNQVFDPPDIYDEANYAIQPVCREHELSYQDVKKLFDYDTLQSKTAVDTPTQQL